MTFPEAAAGHLPRTPALHAREPKAIHRALRVLEAVAELGPGASAKAVSQLVDYPTATTYRLLNLLVQDGYLVRMPDLKGFALGQKVAALTGYLEPIRIPQAVRDLVAEMRGQVRAGVHLLRTEGGTMSIVDADSVFPPPAVSRGRIIHPAAEPRSLTTDSEPAQEHGDISADTDPDTGLAGLAATIRDDNDQPVAVLLLVAASPATVLGNRELELVSHFAQRLKPLLV